MDSASFDPSHWVVIAKWVSAALTFLFAALGLLGENRNEGKITRLGWIALVGFILSAAASFATATAEYDKDLADDRTKAAQLAADLQWQRKVLSDIERQIYSFSRLTATVYVGVSSSSPAFKALQVRLLDLIKPMTPAKGGVVTSPDQTVRVMFAEHEGKAIPVQINIGQKSEFLQDIERSDLYCRGSQLFLYVLGQPLRMTAGKVDFDPKKEDADLVVWYSNRQGASSLSYDLLLGEITYFFHYDDGQSQADKGRVTSILDFTDKSLILGTRADPEKCYINNVQIDAPGTLGKVDSRSAVFSPTSFNLDGGAAGWHRIGPRDFPLRLTAQ